MNDCRGTYPYYLQCLVCTVCMYVLNVCMYVCNVYYTICIGGSSTQIAFFVPSMDINEGLFKLQIGGQKHWNVYTKSFLQFGIVSARKRHIAGIVDSFYVVGYYYHPYVYILCSYIHTYIHTSVLTITVCMLWSYIHTYIQSINTTKKSINLNRTIDSATIKLESIYAYIHTYNTYCTYIQGFNASFHGASPPINDIPSTLNYCFHTGYSEHGYPTATYIHHIHTYILYSSQFFISLDIQQRQR